MTGTVRYPLSVTMLSADEVAALPDWSIIVAEIAEYEGTYTLIKSRCCSLWHTFLIDADGVEIIDDYTPVTPALLVHTGYHEATA